MITPDEMRALGALSPMPFTGRVIQPDPRPGSEQVFIPRHAWPDDRAAIVAAVCAYVASVACGETTRENVRGAAEDSLLKVLAAWAIKVRPSQPQRKPLIG